MAEEVEEVHPTTSSTFLVVYPDKYTPFTAKLNFGGTGGKEEVNFQFSKIFSDYPVYSIILG